MLKWKEVDFENPSTEIQNELLAAALQKQDEFTKEEWGKFKVARLSANSYIKAGDRYFGPAEGRINRELERHLRDLREEDSQHSPQAAYEHSMVQI